MDLEGLLVIGRSLPMFLQATLLNLGLLLGLITLGFLVGIPIALFQVYGIAPLRVLGSAWEWFFRGVPALVLLFLFFFGPTQFGLRLDAFTAAVLALGFRSSGYQSQIFRGAIQAIPRGQMLAARSLGMSRLQAIRWVILPQALRLAIPAWSNEFSSVIKDTTLAYAIGVNEVLRHVRYITDRYYELAMPAYLTVALIFLVLTYGGNWLLGRLERRLAVPGFQLRGVGGETAH
jgi:polar amino acid transport system permease protein